ncbi:transcriptional regulator, partial [Acinetobacter baumannii]|uniref:transcriptional regulator n=1 Tax=Acinetobacter baumannii TaxID=470 RepID=UPI00241E7048
MDNLDSEASLMSPEELKQAGEILYGTQCQTELARAIDVDSSRVRKLMAEERPIPISLSSKIILLL